MADKIEIAFAGGRYELEVRNGELAPLYGPFLQQVADAFTQLVVSDKRVALASVAFLSPLAERLNGAAFAKVAPLRKQTVELVGEMAESAKEFWRDNNKTWPADKTTELAELSLAFKGLELDEAFQAIKAPQVAADIEAFLGKNSLESIAAIADRDSEGFKTLALAFAKLMNGLDKALGEDADLLKTLFSSENPRQATFDFFTVLEPQLAQLSLIWFESLALFYARLAWDWDDLAAVFAEAPLRTLTDIQPADSDPHRRGKVVLILELDAGGTSPLKLVYKPGDVEIDYLVMGRTDVAVPGPAKAGQHRAYQPAKATQAPKASLAESILDLVETGRLDKQVAKDIIESHRLADVPSTPWPFDRHELVGLMELFNRGLREYDLRRYFEDGLGYVSLIGKPAMLALPTYRVLPRYPGSRLETLEDPPGSLPVLRSYGYLEYLAPDPPPKSGEPMRDWFSSQKRAFFRNWGRLQKISLLFSLSDRHADNLIVHDRTPYWIDLENSFIGPVETLGETGMDALPSGAPGGFEAFVGQGFEEASAVARDLVGALQLWMRLVAWAVARQVPVATSKFEEYRTLPLLQKGVGKELLSGFAENRLVLLYGEDGKPEQLFGSLEEKQRAEGLLALAESGQHDFADYALYDIPLFHHRVADGALLDGRGVPIVEDYFQPPALEDVLRQVRKAGRKV